MALSSRTRVRVPEPQEALRAMAALWSRLRASLGKPHNQALLATLLLASVLRLGYLDLIPFGGAEARTLQSAAPLVEAFRLPLVGTPSNLGVLNPPWASYVLAIPTLLFGRDPRVAAAFVVLLNLLALVGCYTIVRRHYGPRPAVLAAVLLAANPWAALSARTLSANSLLVPVGVLLLHGLAAAILDRKPWGWTVACLALGLGAGISAIAWLWAPAILLLMLIYRRRVAWAYVLLGLCLILLVMLPYLYHLSQTRLAGWSALVNVLRAPQSGESPLRVLALAATLHSSANLASLAGGSGAAFTPLAWVQRLADPAGQWWFTLAALLLALLAAYAWGRWRGGEDPARYVLLMAWLWLPLAILLALNPAWLQHRDLLILYPAGFVAMAALLDKVLALPEGLLARRRWWAPLAKLPVWLLFVGLVAWQAYALLYVDTFVARHDTSGGYGTPYRFWRRTAALLSREVALAGADEVCLLGDRSDADTLPVLAYLLGPGTGVVQTESSIASGSVQSMLLPAERPAVYVVTHTSPPIAAAFRQLGAEGKGLVTFPGNRLTASVLLAPAQPAADLLARIQQPGLWAFQGGPVLLGYDSPMDSHAGVVIQVATYWTFTGAPSAGDDTPPELLLSLTAGESAPTESRSAFGLAPGGWRAGQLLVQWSDVLLPTAPGDYQLALGVRRPSDGALAATLDAAGSATGSMAALGTVTVLP